MVSYLLARRCLPLPALASSAALDGGAFLNDTQFEIDLQMRCIDDDVFEFGCVDWGWVDWGWVDWEARCCASKNSCLWRIMDVNCPLNDGDIETFVGVGVDDMYVYMYNVSIYKYFYILNICCCYSATNI